MHLSHLLSILLTLVTAQYPTCGREELGGLFKGSPGMFRGIWWTGEVRMASRLLSLVRC